MECPEPASSEFKVYLVGGAVRDALLGLQPSERDWVVVGATPEILLARGYTPVGRDFPVFLHPTTREEYALARTERKTGPGYTGFEVHADPGVTLRQDLLRRDLTVNALARDPSGSIIDYYGGLRDLRDGLLRHVSPAFTEDPLRVLRVARFAARYKSVGFRVADETLALMGTMADSGELDALVPERVWRELVRALQEPDPVEFFLVLRRCGALSVLLPEINGLWGVLQSPRSHPEIDAGVHTMRVLDQSARLSAEPEVRFAALVHDVGKGLTPKTAWPHHPGHEAGGVPLVEALCSRLRVPRAFSDLARLTTRHHLACHRACSSDPETVLTLLEHTDAFRRPQRFQDFLTACEADFRGRPGYEWRPYRQRNLLSRALELAMGAALSDEERRIHRGRELADILRRRRLAVLNKLLNPGA